VLATCAGHREDPLPLHGRQLLTQGEAAVERLFLDLLDSTVELGDQRIDGGAVCLALCELFQQLPRMLSTPLTNLSPSSSQRSTTLTAALRRPSSRTAFSMVEVVRPVRK